MASSSSSPFLQQLIEAGTDFFHVLFPGVTHIPFIQKMAESKEPPAHGNVPERVINCGDDDNKKEHDDPTEAEFQEELEDETLPFRACDDRTIETNGLRKFSKNLDLERGKSVAGQLTPVCDGEGGGTETKELAVRVKARHGTGRES